MAIQPDTKMTTAQCIALYRVFARCPVYETPEHAAVNVPMKFEDWVYANVSPSFSDVLMVEWAGMFLGIEPDGYTHS